MAANSDGFAEKTSIKHPARVTSNSLRILIANDVATKSGESAPLWIVNNWISNPVTSNSYEERKGENMHVNGYVNEEILHIYNKITEICLPNQ